MGASSHLKILVYAVSPAEAVHQFLLLRRIPPRGGYWQGITGAVEPDEALDEAAIRELTEETALTPTRLLPAGYSYTFPAKKSGSTKSSPTQRVTEYVFLALLGAKVDPTIDPREHDAWDWFTYEEALTWLRWPENIEGLRRCEALIAPSPTPD